MEKMQVLFLWVELRKAFTWILQPNPGSEPGAAQTTSEWRAVGAQQCKSWVCSSATLVPPPPDEVPHACYTTECCWGAGLELIQPDGNCSLHSDPKGVPFPGGNMISLVVSRHLKTNSCSINTDNRNDHAEINAAKSRQSTKSTQFAVVKEPRSEKMRLRFWALPQKRFTAESCRLRANNRF